MCCDETGGVVDDLIAYLRSDDDVFLIPNAANTAEVVRRLRGRRAGGRRRSTDLHEHVRRARRPGPAQRRGARRRSGCRPATTTCRSSRPTGRAARSSSAAPATPASAATSSCPRWDDAPALWDALARGGRGRTTACPAGSARATRCAPRWATRCTATTSSLDITPVQARAGWAVGWKKDAFWGREALAAEKAAGRAAPAWGLLATGRGIPRAHCAVRDADGEAVGEVTSGTFSPDAEAGHRAGAARTGRSPRATRSSSTCAGVRSPRRVVKPPFVQVQTREG